MLAMPRCRNFAETLKPLLIKAFRLFYCLLFIAFSIASIANLFLLLPKVLKISALHVSPQRCRSDARKKRHRLSTRQCAYKRLLARLWAKPYVVLNIILISVFLLYVTLYLPL
jgi:hypothetical protein